MNKIKNYIYISVGMISLLVGMIGVILPILPTTPFLLVSSYCFVKGSKKFDAWFKSTKLYKNHVESFVEEKAMSLKQKITILTTMIIMLSIPFVLVDNLHMRISLIVLVMVKIYYFTFKIKTKQNDKKIIFTEMREN
jgi:uncharacterized membrane protein YbaN (DUF454 family)